MDHFVRGRWALLVLSRHTSTKRRNDDWAATLWRAVAGKQLTNAAATLIFEWLTKARRPMLAQFLTALEVAHEGGLTDADFMQSAAPEKLLEQGKKASPRGGRARCVRRP